MKTIFYKLALPAILLSVNSFSQSLIQKIYPPDPTTAGAFGASWQKTMDQDENTLIVSDSKAFKNQSSGCVPEHGAVMVYKKTGNSWNLAQTIISAYNDTVRFGYDIDFYGDYLAILSSDELSPSGFKTGAVTVYKRADSNSDFLPYTKIYGDEPFLGNTQNFNSVAINGNYLVIAVANLVKVYKINSTSISPHRTFTGNMYAPSKIKMTDNNLVVGIGYDLSHYNILEDTIIMTYNDRGGPYNEIKNFELDGNTIVHEYHGGKSAIQTSYVFMTWNGTSLVSLNAFTDNLTRTYAYSIELKENKWFFATLQSSDPFGSAIGSVKINIYKFSGGQYRKASIIEQDESSSSAFGLALSSSDNILVMGDSDDTTQTNRATGVCNGRKGKGAVSIFSLSNVGVITGINSSGDESKTLSISPNPLKGDLLTVSHPEARMIEVLDISGVSIKTAPVTNNTCNLSGLQKGIYVLRIFSGDQTKTEKLIIE